MDVRLLRAFLAVAECGGFGPAARVLSVTQPALTKQIQALERRLAGPVFVRGRHGATLTELGRSLLPEAQAVVSRIDLLDRQIDRLAAGETGRLSVGFGLSSVEVAPRAVAAFRTRYPGVEVTLDDMSSQTQLDRILAGDLQIGFVRLPVSPPIAGRIVSRDQLAIAAPRSALEIPADSVERTRWLDGRPLIRLARSKGPGLADQIERFTAAAGLHSPTSQVAHDLQTVLALVAADVGVAVVPASAVSIAPPTVAIAALRSPSARWQVGVVWHRDRRSPMIDNFLALL